MAWLNRHELFDPERSDEEVVTRIWYLFPKRKGAHGKPCEPK